MKFKTLHIQNFGTIKDVSIDLDQQGLVLILGRNEDAPKACSNGAGKSLILDAFTWVLWGQTVRGLSHDEVINESVGSNCKVTLTIQDRETEYRITRYRKQDINPSHKPNDLILLVNGDDASGVSVQATQETIESIVSIDFVSFCALMPGAKVRVSEMTDSQIKDLLERLLQTQVFSQAHRQTNEVYKEIQQEHTNLQIELKELVEWLTKVQGEFGTLEQDVVEFEKDRKEKLKTLKKNLANLMPQLTKCTEDIKAGQVAATKKEELSTELSLLHNEIKQCDEEQDGYAGAYHDKVASITKEIHTQELLLKQAVIRDQRVRKLGPECAACEQEISTEHVSSIFEEIEQDKRNSKETIDKCNQEIKDAKDLLETQGAPLVIQMKHHDKQETRIEDELSKIRKVIQAASEAERQQTSIQSHIDHIKKQMKDTKAEVNPFEGLASVMEAQIKDYTKRRDDLESKINDKSHQLALHKFWLDGFSPGGLRSFMLEHVTPVLNAAAKKYADLLTGGEMTVTFDTKKNMKSGSVKENFNIKVSQRSGGSSYTSNSTGERSRSNLVIALALGDLAAMRAHKRIPFRFLDEPFENIDESGTEAVVKLLNEQKELYDTIFVITHQDYFKQMFSNKITMVKSNKTSYLEN